VNTIWLIVIIAVVLGVIVGNITLLKYSAKSRFPVPKSDSKDNQGNGNGFDDEEDGW